MRSFRSLIHVSDASSSASPGAIISSMLLVLHWVPSLKSPSSSETFRLGTRDPLREGAALFDLLPPGEGVPSLERAFRDMVLPDSRPRACFRRSCMEDIAPACKACTFLIFLRFCLVYRLGLARLQYS